MLPRPNILTIRKWVHDPKRRKSRFRCQGCGKLVADGSTLMVERRGASSHGYHADCFYTSAAGQAALERDCDHLFGKDD